MADDMFDANPIPLKNMDTTLRDGHQTLPATRMKREDKIAIAEGTDEVGYLATEVWGGATFDIMHRFLKEGPWERPLTLKKYIKKTSFSMLQRGRNPVGNRNYADDVKEKTKDCAKDDRDRLIRALFPQAGKAFCENRNTAGE